eukprot:14799770-Ditylum_brightwellii.AAC.1
MLVIPEHLLLLWGGALLWEFYPERHPDYLWAGILMEAPLWLKRGPYVLLPLRNKVLVSINFKWLRCSARARNRDSYVWRRVETLRVKERYQQDGVRLALAY